MNFIQKIEEVVKKMNLSEKIFFYLFAFVCAITSLVALYEVNDYFMVEVPRLGGSFTEGLVGSPRFINPVLAISDTDKDLSSLIYSGLMKKTSDDNIELDLASSYTVDESGMVYDFLIKDNAYFHDGKKVTADDVIFTVEKITDPVIKSPKASSWEGVTVEKVSNNEVKFTLKKPYTLFLSALTVGILPKHIWQNVSPEEFPFSQVNIDPVGSGPYKVQKVSKNSGGIPTAISLSAWKKYVSGQPKIKTITFKFFQNESDLLKAYEDQTVGSAAGLSQESAKALLTKNDKVEQAAMPRVFGVFFNQNVAPVFANKEIRQALEISAPKQRIVDEVLLGFGRVINGPTPYSIEPDQAEAQGNIEEARALLAKNGWKENANGIFEKKTKTGVTTFSFSIDTSDSPELKQTAGILQETWQKIGAEVTLKVFESGDLSQNVIKPRKYDALLFGEVVAADSDLYPFWHSSERNDPGLNVSLYTNITVDKKLEEIREDTDGGKRAADKEAVLAEIKNDVPAVFLFSPYFIYAPSPDIKNMQLKDVSTQSERFASIDKWYIETDKVWEIFAPTS